MFTFGTKRVEERMDYGRHFSFVGCFEWTMIDNMETGKRIKEYGFEKI